MAEEKKQQTSEEGSSLIDPIYKKFTKSVMRALGSEDFYRFFMENVSRADNEIQFSNRKEVKDHGDTGILLGSKIKDGDRVVIIEDVTTSGKSMEETVPIVRAQGDVEIIGLEVSLNRCERGKGDKSALEEIKDLYGFKTNAIVTMEEVVEYLYNREVNGRVLIDDNMKKSIDAYYEQYGVR